MLTCDTHCQNKPSWKLPYYTRLVREVSELALQHGCGAVVHSGDFWHDRFGVNPEVLQMLYSEVERSADRGVPWILLRGNHEIGVKSKPHESLLALFANVATVIMKPQLRKFGDTAMYFLPWYLGDQFKSYAQHLARCTVSDPSAKKVLIGHVGLNEGFVSPSNCYRVPQRVSLKDLHPECYNLVFLGDYHTTQSLGDRTMYGGAPIAHQFGDAPNQGVWLLDADGPELKMENLKLSDTYPVYKAVKVAEGQRIPDLKEPRTRYKLQVHIHDLPKVRPLLGKEHIEVESYGTRQVDLSQRRLENVQSNDPIAVFRAFLDTRSIQDPLYRDLGEHALKRAKGELYGKA